MAGCSAAFQNNDDTHPTRSCNSYAAMSQMHICRCAPEEGAGQTSKNPGLNNNATVGTGAGMGSKQDTSLPFTTVRPHNDLSGPGNTPNSAGSALAPALPALLLLSSIAVAAVCHAITAVAF